MNTGKVVEFKNSRGQVVGRIGPRYLTATEAAQMYLDEGWGDEAVVALAVGREESGLSPDAEGDLLIQDAEWGPSIGVMQIRSRKDELGQGTRRDASVLKDPRRNIRESKTIHDEEGFRPWGAYSSGRYEKHLPWARLALKDIDHMTTAQEILKEAAKHIGYTESPAGSNEQKFAPLAGHANGQPWCASFIVAIARACGLTLPSESAYTPSMADGFREEGGFDNVAVVGDVVFFDFPDSKHRIQHVGWLESFTDSTVTCIEGNTSSGSSGSQDNGGCVARRTRSRAYVVGFGHPTYPEKEFLVALSEEQQKKMYENVKSLVSMVHGIKNVSDTQAIGRQLDDIVARLDRLEQAAKAAS